MMEQQIQDKMMSVIFALHGGQEKFDCWLNRTAETLAHPEKLTVRQSEVPEFIPEGYQALTRMPQNVVDLILERMEALKLWRFRADCRNGVVLIIDLSSGHVVESLKNTSLNLQSLATKYGIEL